MKYQYYDNLYIDDEELDPEEGAFLFPGEDGSPYTFVSDDGGVWLVPFPEEERQKSDLEIHYYLQRIKDELKGRGKLPAIPNSDQ